MASTPPPDSKVIGYDATKGPPLVRDASEMDPWPDGYKFHDLPTFEIGLVLAGAVSAGAYLGGVLDFLVEALDAFEAAKDAEYDRVGDTYADWTIPAHNVRIKVISGASAGSMTAAMLASALRYRFPHVRDAASGALNPFYRAWVQQIDMTDFLGSRDLDASPLLHSLLDCTKLDEIVNDVISFHTNDLIERPWLGEPLKFVFTVTNLQGIPYQFSFTGSPGNSYGMNNHADMVRFSLSPAGATKTRADELLLRWNQDAANWAMLGTAALASGSFPVALRSRTIVPMPNLYDASYFAHLGGPDQASADAEPAAPPDQRRLNETMLHIVPSWQMENKPYSYASADGGVIDNEPLELARIELAGVQGMNARNAKEALRAIIMVDPFPDPPSRGTHDDADNANLFSLGAGVIAAMKNQSRFHPDDIALAIDPNVHSRFMVSPTRIGPDGTIVPGGKALSCGALGGFSGFLDESYRHHDFMLGRANCRDFLRRYFTLDIGSEPIALDKEYPQQRNPHYLFTDPKDGSLSRVVVPLFGPNYVEPDADSSAGLAWPVDEFAPEDLRKNIETRVTRIGDVALTAVQGGTIGRMAAKAAWNLGLGAFVRGQISRRVIGAIRKGLLQHQLLDRR